MLGLSSNDIKVKVSSEKDCIQTISVEWPASKVKEQIEKAFQHVQGRVRIPGFRQGKAPMDVVKQNYKDAAYAQAQDDLLQEGVVEALKTKKLNPVQTPVVQTVQFNPEKAFQFEFKVEVSPTFKLGAYKGLKLNRKTTTVSDADINKTLTQIAEMNARLTESKDDTLTNKHFAVIDYEGFLDGKSIPGAKADNFLLDMAAPQAIAGLADGLVGIKTGESRDVKVKFPEDSPAKELAGKEATFTVKLNAIKHKQIPTVDDDFAKDVGIESLEKLKSQVRENMEAEQKQKSQADLENQIIEQLVKENTFALPQSLIDKQAELLVNRQKDRLMQQGVAVEDQAKLLDGMKADIQKQADKEVRLAYVLNAIADAEKIEPTEDDVKARIAAVIERTEPKNRDRMKKLLDGGYADRIRSEIRESKIFEWLIAQAKVKDVTGGS